MGKLCTNCNFATFWHSLSFGIMNMYVWESNSPSAREKKPFTFISNERSSGSTLLEPYMNVANREERVVKYTERNRWLVTVWL